MSVLFKKKYKKFLSISGIFSHKFNISNLILNNLLYISETFFVVSTFYTFIFGLIYFFEKKKVNLISAGEYKYNEDLANKDENDEIIKEKIKKNLIKVEKTAVTSYTFNKVKMYLGDEETFFSRGNKVKPFSDFKLRSRINPKLDLLKYNSKFNFDEKLLIKKKEYIYDTSKFTNFNEIDVMEFEEKSTTFYNNKFSLFSKKKLFLLDLIQSSFLFRRTLLFLFNLLILGGSLLLVNEFFSHFRLFWLYLFVYVHHIFCVSSIWVSGYLSNFTIQKKKNLQLLFSKEKKLYQKKFFLPDFVFVLFSSKIPVISKECRFLGIPLGGLINAFYSPYYFDYMIPANNLMESTIFFFSKFFLELLNKMKLVRKFYFKLNVYSVLKKSDIGNIFFYLGFKTYLKNNNLLFRGLQDTRVGFTLLKRKYKSLIKNVFIKNFFDINLELNLKVSKFYNVGNIFNLLNNLSISLFRNKFYLKQVQQQKQKSSNIDILDYTSSLEKKFYHLFSFLKKKFLRFKKVKKYFMISSKRNFFRQFKILFRIVKFFFFFKKLLRKKRELKKRYFNIFFYKLFIQLMNNVLYFRVFSRSLKKRKKKRFKRFFFRRRKVRKFYLYIKSLLKSNFFLKKKNLKKKLILKKKNRFFFRRHLIFFRYKHQVKLTLGKSVKKKVVFKKILVRKQNYFLRKRLAKLKKYDELSSDSNKVNFKLKKKYKKIFKFIKEKLKHKVMLNKLIFKLISLRNSQLHSKLPDLKFARSLTFLDGAKYFASVSHSNLSKLKLNIDSLTNLRFDFNFFRIKFSKYKYKNYIRLINIVKLFFSKINRLQRKQEFFKSNKVIDKLEKKGILSLKTKNTFFLPIYKNIKENIKNKYENLVPISEDLKNLTWLVNDFPNRGRGTSILNNDQNADSNLTNLNGGFIFLKKLLYFNNSFNVFIVNSIINLDKDKEIEHLSYNLFIKQNLSKTLSQKRLGLGLLKYLRIGLKFFFKYNSYYFSNNFFRSRYGKMYSFKKIFNNFRKSKLFSKLIKPKFIDLKNKNIFSLYLSLLKFVKIKLIFTVLFIKFNLFLIFLNNFYFLFYFLKILIKFYQILLKNNGKNFIDYIYLFKKFKYYIRGYIDVSNLFIFYYLNFKYFYSIFIKNYLNNFKFINFFNYKLFKSFIYKNSKFFLKFSRKFDLNKSNFLNEFFSLKKKLLLPIVSKVRYFNFNGVNFNYYFFKFLIYGFSFKINNIKLKINKFIRDKYSNTSNFNSLLNYKKVFLNMKLDSSKFNYFFLFKFLKTRKNRLKISKNSVKLLNLESFNISFTKIKKKLRKKKKMRRVVYFKIVKKVRNWMKIFGERFKFNFNFLTNFLSNGLLFASGLNFKNYFILENFLKFGSGFDYFFFKKNKRKKKIIRSDILVKLKKNLVLKPKFRLLKINPMLFFLRKKLLLKGLLLKKKKFKNKLSLGLKNGLKQNLIHNSKSKFKKKIINFLKQKNYKFFLRKKFIILKKLVNIKNKKNFKKRNRKFFKKSYLNNKIDLKYFLNFLKKRNFKYFYIKFFLNFLKIFKKFKFLELTRFSKNLKKIFFKKFFFVKFSSYSLAVSEPASSELDFSMKV